MLHMVALDHMKEQYRQETGRVVTLAPDQMALHTKGQGIGMLIILVQEHLEIKAEMVAMVQIQIVGKVQDIERSLEYKVEEEKGVKFMALLDQVALTLEEQIAAVRVGEQI